MVSNDIDQGTSNTTATCNVVSADTTTIDSSVIHHATLEQCKLVGGVVYHRRINGCDICTDYVTCSRGVTSTLVNIAADHNELVVYTTTCAYLS